MLLLAHAGVQEGSCTYPRAAQRSPRSPRGRAGHEPQSSSPKQPSVGSQAVLCLSEPADHRHHGAEDYSGSLPLLSLQEARPQLGQCPPAACPPPWGCRGRLPCPEITPPPSADGLPLPGGPTGGPASRVQELASGGAGGRQGSPEALPHRPRRGGIAGFPELPECERGECALRAWGACSASVLSVLCKHA